MPYKITPPSEVSEINVTPLVDVMLVLLIIFMVITPMLQKGASVDMVRTQNAAKMPNADKTNAVVLAVTRDGRIFLGSNPVKLSDVTSKVKDRIQDRLNKTIYIKSDTRTKYGRVVAIVDDVRAAGVQNIGLLTQKIQGQPPNAPPAPLMP